MKHLPADLITAENAEVVREWCDASLRHKYPDYAPLNPATLNDPNMANIRIWRPEPVHILVEDAPTIGEFIAAVRVASRHLDRMMRLVAEDTHPGSKVEAITIGCRRDYDSDKLTFQIIAQTVIRTP